MNAMPGIDGKRWFACLLLAFMLGGTVFSWYLAGKNFEIADREKNPRLDEIFAPIDEDEARRMAVRYVASESNRAMFSFQGPLQLAAAALAFVFAGIAARQNPGRRDRLIMVFLGLVLLIAIGHAWMVPSIVEQGRAIDFIPRPEGQPDPPEVESFVQIHVVYVIAGLLKALAAAAAIPLLWLSARAAGAGTASPIARPDPRA